MAAKSTSPSRMRRAEELKREQAILHALSSRKKQLEQRKRDSRHKKKSVGELLAMLNLCGIQGAALRPAWEYAPRSYNLQKQIVGLLEFMFVRYPVPAFLYQCCYVPTDDPFHAKHEEYRQWLITLAQGGSFQKRVKPYMTAREATAFLAAPAGGRIHENVWWARLRVAGIPAPVVARLIERLFGQYDFHDPHGRMAEVILFYARFHAGMDRVTFGEVTDFLAWKLRNDRAFSLKGRTLNSVVKLTNEWHVQMQKARMGRSVEWKGLGIPDWEMEARDRFWTVTELRNNRELLNEGRKQKHCVYSYVQACVAGRSNIFSLRGYRKVIADYHDDGSVIWDRTYELSRVTIEVNAHRTLVQVRGPMNRAPSDEEKRILRAWAGEKGFAGRA